MKVRSGRWMRWAGIAIALGLVASACAEESSAGTSGGAGIEAGASKADYRAAFADVDPITLRTQSIAPKGSLTGARYEDYAAALGDWSDGRIEVEIQYSSAIAPPLEWDDALSDGRLDFGVVAPLYEPSEYPVNDRLVSLLFLGSQLPGSGYLELTGWSNEVGLDDADLTAEYEDHGMHVLLPAYTSGSTGMFCATPGDSRDELSGRQVSVGSTTLDRQVKAIGMEPTSVDYTELFESLERGVIDCAGSTPLTLGDAGGIPAAPNLLIDSEVGFAQQAVSFAVSDATWDQLPLVAQQLMFDRLDVFVDATVRATWGQMATYLALAKDEGGKILPLADDARRALADENEAILEDLRTNGGDGLVDAASSAVEEWSGRVDDLGFTEDIGYADFASSYDEEAVDLTGYISTLLGDVLSGHRPR